MTERRFETEVDVQVAPRDPAALVDDGADRATLIDLGRAAVASGLAELAVPVARPRRPGFESNLGVEESAEEGGFFDSVRRLFSKTRVEERQRWTHLWRWPLFLLTCPDVAGAETELTYATAGTGTSRWSLKLFGSGVESATSISFADSYGGVATRGQQSLLFLEKAVDVVEFDLIRSGEVVSRGHRLEVAAGPGVVGWVDLPAAPPWLTVGPPITHLGLRGVAATSTRTWTHQVSYTQAYDLVLGTELGPVSLGGALAYELAKSVTLRATLPGGADWDVVKPAPCAGLLAYPVGAR